MSTQNKCFYGEIRKNIYADTPDLSGAMSDVKYDNNNL